MQQLVAIVFCALVALSAAAPKEIRPTDTNPSWQSVLSGLQAGDVLTVHAGTYTLTGKFAATWTGTETNPIVVQAASGEARPVFQQTTGENIWNLNGAYFTVKGLEFTGGSRGLRLGESSDTSHVVFDGIYIHDIGANAFSANDYSRNYENITLRNSEFSGTQATGECVYLGCSDDGCRTFNSLVEFNYCHDTNTDGSGSAGSGFQIKTGSHNVIVRHNVCKNTPGVCVLMYDDYDRGVNLIEGNVALNVQNDNGIQVTAGAIVRNNLILGWGSGGGGISVISNQPMSGKTPRNVVIEHNTIYDSRSGRQAIYANSVASGEGWVFSNNALYCPQGSALVVSGDLTGVPVTNNGYQGSFASTDSSNFQLSSTVTDVFADAVNNNLYPAVGSKLIKAGDSTHSTETDFNGLSRASPPTVGAYEFSSNSNPGWTVQGGIKQLVGGATNPPPSPSGSGSNGPTSNGPTSSSNTPSSSSTGPSPSSKSPSTNVTSGAGQLVSSAVLMAIVLAI